MGLHHECFTALYCKFIVNFVVVPCKYVVFYQRPKLPGNYCKILQQYFSVVRCASGTDFVSSRDFFFFQDDEKYQSCTLLFARLPTKE